MGRTRKGPAKLSCGRFSLGKHTLCPCDRPSLSQGCTGTGLSDQPREGCSWAHSLRGLAWPAWSHSFWPRSDGRSRAPSHRPHAGDELLPDPLFGPVPEPCRQWQPKGAWVLIAEQWQCTAQSVCTTPNLNEHILSSRWHKEDDYCSFPLSSLAKLLWMLGELRDIARIECRWQVVDQTAGCCTGVFVIFLPCVYSFLSIF